METLRGVLRKVWGYDAFRPLQAEAMRCVVGGRDSVVVLPTGGGKSLCFQAPALHMPGLAVVVSPLIALMKDQVDALVACGVPAACVNSTLSLTEKGRVAEEIRAGRLKLLYLSPERLMTDKTLDFLERVPLSFFAIDEAHCISHWGHDFRLDYRMLGALKERFPSVAVHAYTATATESVRADIVRELRLVNPEILVGRYDRANLVYRVQRREGLREQIRGVIGEHANDSGLIYCIRRADVEDVCASLAALGIDVLPYHAGLSDEERRQNQEAFRSDRAKIIVATVAFGMGIDKSDVRYVIHAAAPKSLEHYQQESGRAGRDGLEAECWLFYSAADFATWRRLQKDLSPQAFEIAMTVLAGIEKYCSGVTCRHRAIARYFGQDLEVDHCGACDVCLGEVDLVEDSQVISQKILSCVLRLKERYGGGHTARVLAGSRDERILAKGHERLSTWGLLREYEERQIRGWVEQLVGQGFLEKSGEYDVLKLTPGGRRVLRGEVTPRLLKPAERARQASGAERFSWEGVDRELFEVLRALRRRKAEERGMPPFIVFGDATLRALARYRPSTRERLLQMHGVGAKKCADYGAEFVREIVEYCRKAGVSMDVDRPAVRAETAGLEDRPISSSRRKAFALFAEGKSIDDVRRAIGRAQSTTVQYLVEHIKRQGIRDPAKWLDAAAFNQIRKAAEQVGLDRLKPIFEALDGSVDYAQVRIAVACLRNGSADQ